MGFAIDGLISGLDTKNIINQLMQLEARPQTLLKNKVSSSQTMISALQQLNTKFASLAELAIKTSTADAVGQYAATSSSESVKLTTTAGAGPGSLDITVDQLAQAQVTVSKQMTAWSAAVPALSIMTGGQTHEFDTDGATLDEVVNKVNAADIGVTAVKVASGKDVDGVPQYRLQFASAATGAESAFTVHQGTAADVTAGTATDFLSAANGGVSIRQAQDAKVTMWAGTAAANQTTSASNTFTELLPGVSVTASAISTAPVTIAVARDAEATTAVAEALVTGLDELFSFIEKNSSVASSVTGGSSSAKGGLFTGDGGVRDMEQRLLAAATSPVNGKSPSDIGISITRGGTVEFDAKKFAAALAANPAGTEAVVQEISRRVSDVATNVSDKRDGGLTLRVQGQESEVGRLNDQVMAWDRRLELRRSTLEAKWTNLELQLSQLQSQGSWLSTQLGNLPSMNGNGN